MSPLTLVAGTSESPTSAVPAASWESPWVLLLIVTSTVASAFLASNLSFAAFTRSFIAEEPETWAVPLTGPGEELEPAPLLLPQPAIASAAVSPIQAADRGCSPNTLFSPSVGVAVLGPTLRERGLSARGAQVNC